MKKIKLLVSVILLLSLSIPVFSQGFTPPASGNAAVYFVRVTSFGGAASFEYFHNEDFIGIFKGQNYMRYECAEGEHLFWASSEDKEFVKCDLKAGETYVILVNVEMGAWKARVGLEPLTTDNKDFERVKKLIAKKKPIITSDKKIKSTQAKLEKRGFIANIMARYEKDWKNKGNTKTMSADMFIPKNQL